jgi:hypothetical protein
MPPLPWSICFRSPSPLGGGENPHDSTRGVLVALEPPVGQAFQPAVRLESLTYVKEVDGG